MKKIFLLLALAILIQKNLQAQSDFEINQMSGTLSVVEQIESIGENLLVRTRIDDQLYHFTRLSIITTDGAVLSQMNCPGPGVGSDVTIYNDTIHQFIPEDGCDYIGGLFSFNAYTAELFLNDQFEGEHAWNAPYFLDETSIHTAQIQMLNDSILLFSGNKGLEFYNTHQHVISDQIAFDFDSSSPSSFALNQDSIVLYGDLGIYLATNGMINEVSNLGFSFLIKHNGLYYGITTNNDIMLLDALFNAIVTIDNNGLDMLDKICFDSGKVYAVRNNPLTIGNLITMTEELIVESEIAIPETDRLALSCFHVKDGRLYAGGTNFSADLMYGSDCVKSYSIESLAAVFQEDIGVTDFLLTDYYFTPIAIEGGPTFYSLNISGTLEVTNFTDQPVENAKACMVSTPLFSPWCSNMVSFFSIPALDPFETVHFNVGSVFYSSQFYSGDYGQTIDTDLCFSTHAPNLHMDDAPENDKHCETVQITVTGILEENTLPSSCYYNALHKTIHIRAEHGSSYALFDISGKKMKEGQVLSSTGSVSAADLSSGIYFVMLESGGKISSMKVLVY